MKKLILALLLLPSLSFAQKTNRGTALVGFMLHEDQIGGSLLLSYSALKYLGIGAGVDLSTYNEELILPFYADLSLKYPVAKFTPFINGQFGKHIYRKKDAVLYTDISGNRIGGDDEIGKYFYGVGAGVAYKIAKVGVFVRYTYRDYKFKMEGTTPQSPTYSLDSNQGIKVVTLGITL